MPVGRHAGPGVVPGRCRRASHPTGLLNDLWQGLAQAHPGNVQR
jgi:hypothetical protein